MQEHIVPDEVRKGESFTGKYAICRQGAHQQQEVEGITSDAKPKSREASIKDNRPPKRAQSRSKVISVNENYSYRGA